MPHAGFQHYPPVRTPLSLPALVRALPALAGRSRDALDRLSAELASFYRADHVMLFGSGTQALSAAIARAFDPQRINRIVALPGYNCYDLASAAVAADARIIVYDIDPDTLSPDWDSFDAALAAGATAAVVAPLYGYPIDWQRAEQIASRHGATVIEDAAQGIGGSWQDAPLGSLGRMSVLSFGRGKGWTGGGGGALLLRNDNNAPAHAYARTGTRARAASAALRAGAQWLLSNPLLYTIPASIPWLHIGETRYREPAASHTMTSFEAALLLATASAARREAAERFAAGSLFTNEFADAAHARTIRVVGDGVPGWLRFPLRIPSPTLRARVLEQFRRFGIAAAYPGMIADLDVVRSRLVPTASTCAGSNTLVRELVTLPTYNSAIRGVIERVVSMLR